MATIQTIVIGTIANDGTGDTLRNAFDKTNQNFASLNATTPKLMSKTLSTFSSTGVTTLQLAASALIPANTFSANDIMSIQAYYNKVNVGASYTCSIWINTTLTLTGATQIATYLTPSSSVAFVPLSRSFTINSNILYGASFVTSNLVDAVGNRSSATFTTTSAIYIMFAIQTTSTTDNLQFSGFRIIS